MNPTFSPTDKENFLRLRIPLLLLALSIGTGLGLHLGSVKLRENAENQLNATEAKLAAARSARQHAKNEQQELQQYLPSYQRLVADGLIGEAERFELIDTLKKIGAQNQLYPVEYVIDAPRPYPLAAIPADSGLQVTATPLSLRLSLLHEGDLMALLQGLRTGLKGMTTVNRCEITRRDIINTTPALKENLAAECHLDWMSLAVPSTTVDTR
ncbi:MAG: hypothetical protein AB7U30_10190 [Sulfuricellaceae bacterium]|jgi:hypothetical protein